MEKQWKRFVKRMNRLFDNVRKGSVADIAILVSGVALVGTLVTVVVVQLLPQKDVPVKGNASSLSVSATSSSSASNTGAGAVNPFPQSSSSQATSSSKVASSSKAVSSSKAPASSSKKPVAVSSSSAAPAASPAPPPPESNTPAPPPPPTGHTHVFPDAWTREGANCEDGNEVRFCINACPENPIKAESRAITGNGQHAWGGATVVQDIENPGQTLYTLQTCGKCHTQMKTFPDGTTSTGKPTS